MKEFADNNFKIDGNGRKFSKWVGHSQREISPSSTVFSKVLYNRHIKTRACLGNWLDRETFLQFLSYQGIRVKSYRHDSLLLKVYLIVILV